MFWNVVFPKEEQCSKASGRKQRKPCHHMFWFYKLAALVGLESSSEETELFSDVRGVPLDIACKDFLFYKKNCRHFSFGDRKANMKFSKIGNFSNSQ